MSQQDEIKNLYAEYGELAKQIQLANARIMVVDQRLNQLLGIHQQPNQPQIIR